ncbi:hypothetical protein AMAG_01626 [Allomyces macrogynus ATCC 38327]|uniref:Uncharacterized protein n=1 Tax=Allomyces macrogynus (strain ATCC 38327) TaxID=578462 RepID=A0A0L0S088_ALLM3|nr:hypothetical protein AMAG_01626 [Allomyces macrogynus ATCC 38327]|eukprot:KNE55749.1 hypothetical protein AMAG_01626 [Allomyces macrogynus ATCC 38327]
MSNLRPAHGEPTTAGQQPSTARAAWSAFTVQEQLASDWPADSEQVLAALTGLLKQCFGNLRQSADSSLLLNHHAAVAENRQAETVAQARALRAVHRIFQSERRAWVQRRDDALETCEKAASINASHRLAAWAADALPWLLGQTVQGLLLLRDARSSGTAAPVWPPLELSELAVAAWTAFLDAMVDSVKLAAREEVLADLFLPALMELMPLLVVYGTHQCHATPARRTVRLQRAVVAADPARIVVSGPALLATPLVPNLTPAAWPRLLGNAQQLLNAGTTPCDLVQRSVRDDLDLHATTLLYHLEYLHAATVHGVTASTPLRAILSTIDLVAALRLACINDKYVVRLLHLHLQLASPTGDGSGTQLLLAPVASMLNAAATHVFQHDATVVMDLLLESVEMLEYLLGAARAAVQSGAAALLEEATVELLHAVRAQIAQLPFPTRPLAVALDRVMQSYSATRAG